jgi:hypothetical protein
MAHRSRAEDASLAVPAANWNAPASSTTRSGQARLKTTESITVLKVPNAAATTAVPTVLGDLSKATAFPQGSAITLTAEFPVGLNCPAVAEKSTWRLDPLVLLGMFAVTATNDTPSANVLSGLMAKVSRSSGAIPHSVGAVTLSSDPHATKAPQVRQMHAVRMSASPAMAVSLDAS